MPVTVEPIRVDPDEILTVLVDEGFVDRPVIPFKIAPDSNTNRCPKVLVETNACPWGPQGVLDDASKIAPLLTRRVGDGDVVDLLLSHFILSARATR
jgi:hypothetical protein